MPLRDYYSSSSSSNWSPCDLQEHHSLWVTLFSRVKKLWSRKHASCWSNSHRSDLVFRSHDSEADDWNPQAGDSQWRSICPSFEDRVCFSNWLENWVTSFVSSGGIGANISRILDDFFNSGYDKRVRPNYGGEIHYYSPPYINSVPLSKNVEPFFWRTVSISWMATENLLTSRYWVHDCCLPIVTHHERVYSGGECYVPCSYSALPSESLSGTTITWVPLIILPHKQAPHFPFSCSRVLC